MNQEIEIVFIHGAGLGSFIWKDVISYIDYPTLLFDFPNRNNNFRANVNLRFDDYVDQAIKKMRNFGKQKLILVSHSIGGLVGLRIAKRFKDKIIGFIAIGAAIPNNGNSFISCLPFPQKILLPILMKFAGTMPPRSAIEKGLCNDLDEAQTEKVVQNFTAESKYLYTDKSNSVIPDTMKLYIQLTGDKEFPISMQRKMAENLNCNNIETLQNGHLPMISVPEKLSEILNDFIDECMEQDGQILKSQS